MTFFLSKPLASQSETKVLPYSSTNEGALKRFEHCIKTNLVPIYQLFPPFHNRTTVPKLKHISKCQYTMYTIHL